MIKKQCQAGRTDENRLLANAFPEWDLKRTLYRTRFNRLPLIVVNQHDVIHDIVPLTARRCSKMQLFEQVLSKIGNGEALLMEDFPVTSLCRAYPSKSIHCLELADVFLDFPRGNPNLVSQDSGWRFRLLGQNL